MVGFGNQRGKRRESRSNGFEKRILAGAERTRLSDGNRVGDGDCDERQDAPRSQSNRARPEGELWLEARGDGARRAENAAPNEANLRTKNR